LFRTLIALAHCT